MSCRFTATLTIWARESLSFLTEAFGCDSPYQGIKQPSVVGLPEQNGAVLQKAGSHQMDNK